MALPRPFPLGPGSCPLQICPVPRDTETGTSRPRVCMHRYRACRVLEAFPPKVPLGRVHGPSIPSHPIPSTRPKTTLKPRQDKTRQDKKRQETCQDTRHDTYAQSTQHCPLSGRRNVFTGPSGRSRNAVPLLACTAGWPTRAAQPAQPALVANIAGGIGKLFLL